MFSRYDRRVERDRNTGMDVGAQIILGFFLVVGFCVLVWLVYNWA
jgi:hypothetical protein